MIDLEDRVGVALHTAAESVTHAPLDPTRPVTLARQRRRNRRIGRAMAALVALIGLGAVVQLAAGNSLTVQTADEDGLDEQGVPVDTGQELEWKPVEEAADLRLREVVWSGERFLALGGEERGTLYSSPDGQDWESLPDGMPDDFVFGVLTAGDERVVAWGWDQADSTGNTPLAGPPTVLVSDDHGENWQNLGSVGDARIDDDPTDFVTPGDFLVGAAVVGDTIMVAQVSHMWVSLEEVLVDRGILQPGDELVIETEEWRTDTGRASATYCLNPTDQWCGDDVETIDFDTRLPEDQRLGEGSTTVLTSTGDGPFEPIAEFESEAAQLVSTQGRFFMVMYNEGGQLLATDDNGLTWAPVTIGQAADGAAGVARRRATIDAAASGDDLVVVTNTEGRIEGQRSTDGGQTWTTTALAASVENIAVGPGGQLMTARVYGEQKGAVGTFLDWLAELGGADNSPPAVIGWTPDGVNWGWQSRADAFGTKGWTEVAVGETTAVAVAFPDANDGGRVDWPEPSLFIAEIPS